MGSLDENKVFGTLTFPRDVPPEEYDPWVLPYGKAPDAIHKDNASRRLPLTDFRGDVFDNAYSKEKSQKRLRQFGFTAVKNRSALQDQPYGSTQDFLNPDLINEIYYPEIEALIKGITGCSKVFITDSLVRSSDASKATPSNTVWKKTVNKSNAIHKDSLTAPARILHWDFIPSGVRGSIRNVSEQMSAHARSLNIIQREDELCAPGSATTEEAARQIDTKYDGARYAAFSVWRPLKTVTRDPLVMGYNVDADPDLSFCVHQIKQPGVEGDWLRDLATLRVDKDAPTEKEHVFRHGAKLFYLSEQQPDEVLILKAFDSAALPSQQERTGEAPGVAHASPDLGDAAYGDARESIEVRLVAFW